SQASTAGRHVVPAAMNPSVGQLVETPSQFSLTSQKSTAARQTVPALPAGCWQEALAPSHWSRVQTLPSSVQAVPLARNVSVGQAVEAPVHVSAASQIPAEARHTVPDDCNASAGHAVESPVHASATSHTPAEARHTVPNNCNVSAGHTVESPVHASVTSHTP